MRLLPRPTASSAFQSDPGWKIWLGKRACSQRKESRPTGTDFFRGLKDVRLGDSVDVYTEKGNTRVTSRCCFAIPRSLQAAKIATLRTTKVRESP
jgi:hypothetical protein